MIFLTAGGFQEIQKMCYWDFLTVWDCLNVKRQRDSGGKVFKKMKPSQKKMIERRKEVVAREKMMKNG